MKFLLENLALYTISLRNILKNNMCIEYRTKELVNATRLI
jgi:hypothetical protein